MLDPLSAGTPRRKLPPIHPRLHVLEALDQAEPTEADPGSLLILPRRSPTQLEMLAPDRIVPLWEQEMPASWRPEWEIYRQRVLRRTRNPLEAGTLQFVGTAVKQLGWYLEREGITPRSVRRHDIEDFFIYLRSRHVGPGNRINSVPNARFRALRAFFNELKAANAIKKSPMKGLQAPEIEVMRDGRPLTKTEVLRLLDACIPDLSRRAKLRSAPFRAARDKALIGVLAENGSRAEGLLSATVEGLDLTERVLYIRLKGGKPWKAPFSETVAGFLIDYLSLRSLHPHVRLSALWLGEDGAFGVSGLRRMLKVRAAQAGIKLDDVYAHVFRYGIADHLLDAEVPEADIAGVMGYQDLVVFG